LVTAALLALALPPFANLGLSALGCASAILLAKHAYGGYGNNIFNPAMAGYALLLVLYPAQLAHWPAPNYFDGITGATTLDLFKQNNSELVADWWLTHAQFGRFGGYGWEWINAAFLGGGLYLLQRKLFSWHAPICALAAIGVMALLFYDNGSSASGGSPLLHWFSGGTMLGIFFVVTEPVTAPASTLGRAIYGALIGALIFSIRHWGHYADGIAFAVLFGNAITPLLDRALIKLRESGAIADEQHR
jgi:electron transport complex protein RnfD